MEVGHTARPFLIHKTRRKTNDRTKINRCFHPADCTLNRSLGHGSPVGKGTEMLGTASAKSVEEIKAFLSRQKETYKVPYDRFPKDRPRQCVFVGTSNKQRFLPLDRTGNRRFYPIMTDSSKAVVHVLSDEEATRKYMRQLWAEVMVIYQSGEYSLCLPKEMEHQLSLHRMNFLAEDTASGMLQAWLDGFQGDYVCTKQIYNEAYRMSGSRTEKPSERSTIS